MVRVRLVTSSAEVDVLCDERIKQCRSARATAGQEAVSTDDARTLSVKYGADGTRRRIFRDSSEEMLEADFADWPVLGPRTCLWNVREICKMAEGPRAQHTMWVRGAKIPDGDRAIFEDEVLASMMEMAVTYDGLNIANLASFELLCRRRQLLAEAHVHNPGAPSYSGSEYYMGLGLRPGAAVVSPMLTQHVSEKMKSDSMILKERRKADETRSLAMPRRKGKGKGEGEDK
jgi:hypothetical protein